MTTSRLRVTRTGPHVTFQDAGRPGLLRYGIPGSGPMDRLAHATGNAVLGNDIGATAIEISRAGLEIECIAGTVTIAVTGGGFATEHKTTPIDSWAVVTIHLTERVSVQVDTWGSWAYLTIAGRIEAQSWLGHTATHTLSGFGGGTVSAGQEILVSDCRVDVARDGPITVPALAQPTGTTRVVLGPQDHHFGPCANLWDVGLLVSVG